MSRLKPTSPAKLYPDRPELHHRHSELFLPHASLHNPKHFPPTLSTATSANPSTGHPEPCKRPCRPTVTITAGTRRARVLAPRAATTTTTTTARAVRTARAPAPALTRRTRAVATTTTTITDPTIAMSPSMQEQQRAAASLPPPPPPPRPSSRSPRARCPSTATTGGTSPCSRCIWTFRSSWCWRSYLRLR